MVAMQIWVDSWIDSYGLGSPKTNQILKNSYFFKNLLDL